MDTGEAKTSESFSEQTGSNHFNSEMSIGAEWTYLHLGHMLKTVTPPHVSLRWVWCVVQAGLQLRILSQLSECEVVRVGLCFLLLVLKNYIYA